MRLALMHSSAPQQLPESSRPTRPVTRITRQASRRIGDRAGIPTELDLEATLETTLLPKLLVIRWLKSCMKIRFTTAANAPVSLRERSMNCFQPLQRAEATM